MVLKKPKGLSQLSVTRMKALRCIKCDQIGLFLKGHGNDFFAYKIIPNV